MLVNESAFTKLLGTEVFTFNYKIWSKYVKIDSQIPSR